MPIVPKSNGPSVQAAITPDARQVLPGITPEDTRLTTPQISTPQLSTPQVDTPLLKPGLKDPNAIRTYQMADTGAQFRQAGGDLLSASANMAAAVRAYQLKVNATVVDDALDQARTAAMHATWGQDDGHGNMVGGYKQAKGEAAVHPEGGKSLDEVVIGNFTDQVKAIAKAKLTNGDQQRAFQMQVNSLTQELRQGVSSHMSEQFDAYHKGVYTGTIQNQTAAFATVDPTDRVSQKIRLDELDASVATLAASEHTSPQQLEVAQRSARGAAVASLFDKVMADKNYKQAQALLNEWGGLDGAGKPKIDPDIATKMKLAIDGKVTAQLGEQLGDDVIRQWAAPAYSATTLDRSMNILFSMESPTGQTTKDGKLVVSPTGNYGAGQLGDDTAKAAAKRLGHPELAALAKQPTKAGEAANRLLARNEFEYQVSFFNGDQEKAAAAYNAGQAWLIGGKDRHGNPIEGAIPKAARLGGDWRDYLPAETQKYIATFKASFGAGEGVPAKPKLNDLYAALDARTSDPDVRRAGYSRIERYVAAAEHDEQRGHEEAYARGVAIVDATGGNINAIPTELKAAIKPENFTQLEGFAKDKIDGRYNTTQTGAYIDAIGLAQQPKTTEAQLVAMRPKLSENDWNTVRGIWMEKQAPSPGKGPQSLDVSTVDSILKQRLAYLGVDVNPKKSDKNAQAILEARMQFAHNYILDLQRGSGKKFEDYKEIEGAIDQMFLKDQRYQGGIFGTPHAENVMSIALKDIPSDAKARLKTEFKTLHGGRDPEDPELLQAYFRSQFYHNAPRIAPRVTAPKVATAGLGIVGH
jgi:hypothetical protein